MPNQVLKKDLERAYERLKNASVELDLAQDSLAFTEKDAKDRDVLEQWTALGQMSSKVSTIASHVRQRSMTL